ncbi:MAG TPA: glycoside hydrolase family 3 N-terminal domain-containing protein [Steroidobacteraceae bacterium]|nr:glycoside hydrolase family 3 N-terminal domain-containing protein [Steroidobacteraceae bacterium]
MKRLALRSRSCIAGLMLMVGCAAATAVSAASSIPLYKDPKASVDARVEDLLARMTLEEKIAQISSIWTTKAELFDSKGRFDPAKAKAKYPHGIGQFARPSDRQGPVSPRVVSRMGVKETVELINAMQKYATRQTRLGIPIWFHEEGLHGYATAEGTSFPQAIGLASTWDPELLQQIYSVVAREIRARGVQQVLAPVVDVAREPRWGRIEETLGEDPYLVGELGVAIVRGFQGDALPLAPDKVFATLKHMTGHGQPENGTNTGPAEISERTLREEFFPPFEQVVKRTNIFAVMPSYNEIDGVPSHANRWLLTDVLRGEWGFKGAVTSDYFAIEELKDRHHVEPDYAAAAIRALNAGVDVDLPDGQAFATLVDSVRAGRVSEERVNEAVRRMLKMKFLSGSFENPYADAKQAVSITDNAEARKLAELAARKSIVLLKNDGVLPLNRAKLHQLAVIGPNAAAARLGGYTGDPRHTVTMLDGLRNKLGSQVQISYAEGVKITRDDDWWADKVELVPSAENEPRIAEAVKAAQNADAVVLFLGDTEQTSREAWADNHLGDRSSLGLVGDQDRLAQQIFALGKPTVVVLLNGRPLSVVNIAERANALVEGWYLGQEGGTAMADTLFGDANPGGKLPLTIARDVGQLPVFYNHKPSARRGYLFDTTKPLFPFGFGLSYTTFDISAPRLSSNTINDQESVDVSVDVRNSGSRAGDEVVQLYIHDQVSSVTRPVKELKGFQRVTLAPGESKTVTFKLTPESLAMWDAHMKRVVEPGVFDVMVGSNSEQLKSIELRVASSKPRAIADSATMRASEDSFLAGAR